jgi:hypothetical protein
MISQWDGRMKAVTASMCVSVVAGLYLLSFYIWFLVVTGLPLGNKWLVVFTVTTLTSADYFLFVAEDRGDLYEERFYNYSSAKQGVLLVCAIVITIGAVAIFIYSVQAYHRKIGIAD